jgi:SAM-dependent methyltransferase
MTDERAQLGQHWERVYSSKSVNEVSWYEPTPETSVRLVLSEGVPDSVIDVGAGASTLVDELLERGVPRVTALDLSLSALSLVHHRLEELGNRLTTIVGDVLTWRPDETYDVWHDRAVFHFLTDDDDGAAYVRQVRLAVAPGGLVVVGTFAEDGPEQCSGLPTRRYSAQSLAEVFGTDFTLVHSERIEHHTPWDTVQPFTWVVLRAPDSDPAQPLR